MRRFVDPALPNPPEDETSLGRGAPDAHEPAADASQESPPNAPAKSARRARKTAASLGPAPAARLDPLSGGPELAERPERKRRRRTEKNPAGQGPAPQRVFPEAGFPLWARLRRGADEGREAAESIDQLSSNPRRLERHPEERGLARRASGGPVWRGREEGRGAEEVLDCGPLGGRSMGGHPEGRGFATRADEVRRFDFALEPVPRGGENLTAPPTGRPFESRAHRGFRHENTGDGCGEEFGPSRKGRGPDIGREALSAAAASARLLGRGEDEAALRDAFALRRPGDDPGPAGRLLAAWRRAASCRPDLVFEQDRSNEILFDLGLPRSGPILESIEEAAALARSDRPAVFAAAEAAAQTFRMLGPSHGREAEILSLLLADAVLACRLRWPGLVPLLAGVIFDPELRRGPEGKRVRPDDPDWPRVCCLGFARAAAGAHDLARDLARRAEKLEAAVPGLRTKGIEGAVARFLSEDVVAAPMRPGHLSERAARRLLDRLVALGALRELTGRPSFRLYGL